jgi:enediyne biosynthesis protein E4
LLLHNRAAKGRNWIGLHLQGVDCNRDAVGAKVSWTVEGKRRTRVLTAGGSYLASHDPRVLLGLGDAEKVDFVEIEWPQPSGRVERLEDIPLNRYLRVVEGKGVQDAV